jgi:hypothetical protein
MTAISKKDECRQYTCSYVSEGYIVAAYMNCKKRLKVAEIVLNGV